MIISFTLSFEIFIHKTNKCCDRINKKGDPTQFDISVLNLLLLVGHTLTAFIHFLRYSRRLAVSILIETCYKKNRYPIAQCAMISLSWTIQATTYLVSKIPFLALEFLRWTLSWNWNAQHVGPFLDSFTRVPLRLCNIVIHHTEHENEVFILFSLDIRINDWVMKTTVKFSKNCSAELYVIKNIGAEELIAIGGTKYQRSIWDQTFWGCWWAISEFYHIPTLCALHCTIQCVVFVM